MRCHENFFGYEDNQFGDIIAPKMRENSEVNMQSSATAALFEEDVGHNPRPESAYKIFAPKQLVTTELGEEEKQQVHHTYNKQPSSGILAFSAIMGSSPTGFAEDGSDNVAGTPELRSKTRAGSPFKKPTTPKITERAFVPEQSPSKVM